MIRVHIQQPHCGTPEHQLRNIHFADVCARSLHVRYRLKDALMATDPVVEELDSFGLLLPLPYRLSILVVLGIWLWGLNLHGLRLLKIVGASTFAYTRAILTRGYRRTYHTSSGIHLDHPKAIHHTTSPSTDLRLYSPYHSRYQSSRSGCPQAAVLQA